MYALSVRQPFASQIASGEKDEEYRAYKWSYRGPLVICATKSPKVDSLPCGVAVCIVEMVDCIECEDDEGTFYAWVLERPRAVKPVSIKGAQRPFKVGPEVERLF